MSYSGLILVTEDRNVLADSKISKWQNSVTINHQSHGLNRMLKCLNNI